MNNVINYDGYIVGYKEDLLNYMKKEVENARKDLTIGVEELTYILEQTSNAAKDIEQYDDLTLLALGENWNSDFVVRSCGIDFEM